MATLDQRDRPAAHVFPLTSGPAQVGGKGDVGDDRGQLGPQGRLDADALDRIADLDIEPARVDLRRQFELVAAVPQRGHDRMLLAELRDALAGRQAVFSVSRSGDRKRLAVRRRPSLPAAARAP